MVFKVKDYTVRELITELEKFDDDSRVTLDLYLGQLLLEHTHNDGVDNIFLTNDRTVPQLDEVEDKKYNRFHYWTTARHGRRCPPFIKDYLTNKTYSELEYVVDLLNKLWNKSRVNDALRYEIIKLRNSRLNYLDGLKQERDDLKKENELLMEQLEYCKDVIFKNTSKTFSSEIFKDLNEMEE